MSNESRVSGHSGPSVFGTQLIILPQVSSVSHLNKVIFREKAAETIGRKFFSLFPGLGYAAGYKVLQRIYKFGGQPIARDYLGVHYGAEFERVFGKKTGKAMMHSAAGRLVPTTPSWSAMDG